MRKACPGIVKKQHSDGVSYKYAKIYDVWEKITPIMNELGVDFDVISEQATRHAENGDRSTGSPCRPRPATATSSCSSTRPT